LVSKPTFVVCALVSCLSLSAQDTPGTPKPSGPPKDTEIVTTASGLKYSILQKGDGERAPKMGERVTVHYTGWLEDGTKFDSSRDNGKPFAFVLGVGQVIKGWDEGVALMTKGTRCKLTIPYDLAYGEDGRPPRIPAKATLIFDVELLSIKK
jgi:peptidylprolyl isomerase